MNSRRKPRQTPVPRKGAAAPAPRSRLSDVPAWAACGVIAVAVLLVYGGSLSFPFVYDDHPGILKNPSIRRLWPLVGDAKQRGPLNPPRDISTSGRPLANFSFALNHHFGGLRPHGYRAINIALHFCCAILLWAVVRRCLGSPYAAGRFDDVAGALALCVAIAWAVHPLNSEAIVYVTQRTELLMAFFYLATLYASCRYWTSGSTAERAGWLSLAATAAFGGACSKEVIVTVPVVALLLERTLWQKPLRQLLHDSWPLYTALATSWLAQLALNYSGPRANSAGFSAGVPLLGWWGTQAKVLLMYLKLVVWPWPLTIYYALSPTTTLAESWPWLLAAGVLVLASFTYGARGSAAGMLASIALLILSPTLLVPIRTEVAAERRMYLPLAAILALLLIGLYVLATRSLRDGKMPYETSLPVRRRIIIGVTVALTLALGVVTGQRVAVYGTAVSLWKSALAPAPDNATIRNNLGDALTSSGLPQEAVPHLVAAIRSRPDFVLAHVNLGIANMALGQLQQAAAEFGEAVRLAPDDAQAHYNLGVAQYQLGSVSEAIDSFAAAVKLDPDFAAAHNNLAAAFNATGQSETAEAEYRKAIDLDPMYAEAYFGLAHALLRQGRLPAAHASAEHALSLTRVQKNAALEQQIVDWLRANR